MLTKGKRKKKRVEYEPGVSTLAGAFTRFLPKITAEEINSACLSVFSISDPTPRPIISTDLRVGFFDSDLNLLSSYVPSTVPIIEKEEMVPRSIVIFMHIHVEDQKK